MKLYRLHYYTEESGSRGYAWFASKASRAAAASAYMKQACDEEGAAAIGDEIEVSRLTKKAVLDLLNKYASHNDNG